MFPCTLRFSCNDVCVAETATYFPPWVSEALAVLFDDFDIYDVSHIATALRQFFGEGKPVGNSGHAEHDKHDSDRDTKGEKGRKRDCICGFCKKKGHIEDDCYKKKKMMKRLEQDRMKNEGDSPRKDAGQNDDVFTFYTLNAGAQSEHISMHMNTNSFAGAIVDSGAVGSIMGQDTLHTYMNASGINHIRTMTSANSVHRFGYNGEPIEPTFAGIIPWSTKDANGEYVFFNIKVDVLPGGHPMILGLPALAAMRAVLDIAGTRMRIETTTTHVIPLSKLGKHIVLGFDYFPAEAKRGVLDVTNQSSCNSTFYSNPSAELSQANQNF